MEKREDELTKAKDMIKSKDLTKLERKLEKQVSKATNLSKYVTAKSLNLKCQRFLYLQCRAILTAFGGVLSLVAGIGLGDALLYYSEYMIWGEVGLPILLVFAVIVIIDVFLIGIGIITIISSVIILFNSVFFPKKKLSDLLNVILCEIDQTKRQISDITKEDT